MHDLLMAALVSSFPWLVLAWQVRGGVRVGEWSA